MKTTKLFIPFILFRVQEKLEFLIMSQARPSKKVRIGGVHAISNTKTKVNVLSALNWVSCINSWISILSYLLIGDIFRIIVRLSSGHNNFINQNTTIQQTLRLVLFQTYDNLAENGAFAHALKNIQ